MDSPFLYFGQAVDSETMFQIIKRDHQALLRDIRRSSGTFIDPVLSKCIDTNYGVTEVIADFNAFPSSTKISLFLLNDNSLFYFTEYDSVLTKFLITNYPKTLGSLNYNITKNDFMLFVRCCARRNTFNDNMKFVFQDLVMSCEPTEEDIDRIEQEFWRSLHDRFDFSENKHMTHLDEYQSLPLNRYMELFGIQSDDISKDVQTLMLEFIDKSNMWAFNVGEIFRYMAFDKYEILYEDFFKQAYLITLKNHYSQDNIRYIPSAIRSKLNTELNKLKLTKGAPEPISESCLY